MFLIIDGFFRLRLDIEELSLIVLFRCFFDDIYNQLHRILFYLLLYHHKVNQVLNYHEILSWILILETTVLEKTVIYRKIILNY